MSQRDQEQIEEISILSSELNQMLEQIEEKDGKILAANAELEKKVEVRTQELQEIQQTALENAHAAGMAEIATGTLHNIGNIINSVNTSADELFDIMQRSKMDHFIKANELLQSHSGDRGEFLTNDPKGKILPEYYLKLGEALKSEHDQLKTEVNGIIKKISLIKDVVQTQQAYAKKELFFEEMSLAHITDEILNLQKNSLSRHRIQIVKNYWEDMPPVRVQKVKFAHILMNLIKNAKESMASRPIDERKIVVESGKSEADEFFLKITDNGEGIESHHLEKIFSHGFTTKRNGHGFGLHFCANAMTEMGGKLLVDSKGPGQGASFTLIFSASRYEKETKHA